MCFLPLSGAWTPLANSLNFPSVSHMSSILRQTLWWGLSRQQPVWPSAASPAVPSAKKPPRCCWPAERPAASDAERCRGPKRAPRLTVEEERRAGWEGRPSQCLQGRNWAGSGRQVGVVHEVAVRRYGSGGQPEPGVTSFQVKHCSMFCKYLEAAQETVQTGGIV